MIYLEEPQGAILYDGLPSAPSYWELINTTASSSGSGDGGYAVEGVEEGGGIGNGTDSSGQGSVVGEGESNVTAEVYRVATPDHYLILYVDDGYPIGAMTPSLSLAPTTSLADVNATGVGNVTSSNATASESAVNATNNYTMDTTTNTTNATSLFGRRIASSTTPTVSSVPSLHSSSPPSSLHSLSSIPTIQSTPQPTASPHPTPPSITGEYTPHLNNHHPYFPSPSDDTSTNSTDDIFVSEATLYQNTFHYFNDTQLITHDPQYVYYDSKQARFGQDLGPRGNSEFVNLMLPPRWRLEGLDGVGSGEEDEGGVGEEGGLGGGNGGSLAPSRAPSTGGGLRKVQSVDELLGLDGENGASPSLPSSTPSVQIIMINQTTNGTKTNSTDEDDTSLANSSNFVHETSISDYFCLEDFIQWRTQQRICSEMTNGTASDANVTAVTNVSSEELQLDPCPLNISELFLADASSPPSPSINPHAIASTRPLTIMASRGRCSFESKAQMAMTLNQMFAAAGKSNRIDNVIVYNNGTDDDEEEDAEEKLIDMSLIQQVWKQENDWNVESSSPADDAEYTTHFTVGMLYVTTTSGEDMMHRIMDRENATGRSPHLDVSSLFLGEILSERRQRTVDGSTKDDGEHDDSLDPEVEAIHDPDVTHGWFFPATLTRFCLACGLEKNYGFSTPVLDTGDVELDSNEGEWNNNGPILFPPKDNEHLDDRIEGYYNGQYVTRPWVESVRKLMIAILVILLVGPLVLAVKRWHSVGGTVRVARDEDGTRHLRLIAPNLEVFFNGVPGAVEENGTKLDRRQVFALPEVEFVGATDNGSIVNIVSEDSDSGGFTTGGDNANDTPNSYDSSMDNSTTMEAASGDLSDDLESSTSAPSPPIPTSYINDCVESGRFISSTCCSICLDEFVHGERIRLLPRCNHAFHTECILPWLTERQGCCPMCKSPVLPDEYQRNRRSRTDTRGDHR
jgi:hypothetical protein